jgi:hypothetical protein
VQAPSAEAHDRLASLSGPVRDCILKAARLCESSRAGGGAPRPAAPDMPIDSMLQLVMSLDAPAALSCLTQMYAPPGGGSPQGGDIKPPPMDFDHKFEPKFEPKFDHLHHHVGGSLGVGDGGDHGLPGGLHGAPAGNPFSSLPSGRLSNSLGLGGSNDGTGNNNGANSLGLNLSALTGGHGNGNNTDSGLGGGLNGLSASFLAPTPRDAPAPLTTANGPRSSISQMSSQLRALCEEREPPGGHATGGLPHGSFRQAMTQEEQLASLLAAPNSFRNRNSDTNSMGGSALGNFHGLNSPLLPALDNNGGGSGAFGGGGGHGGGGGGSLLSNLQTKDALNSLLAGGDFGGLGGTMGGLLSTGGGARGPMDGSRDLWPQGGLPGHLLEERTPRSATL